MVCRSIIDANAGVVVTEQNNFWVARTVVDTTGVVVSTMCLYSAWHTFECTGNAMWFVSLCVLALYWRFMGERERYAAEQYKHRTKAQIAKLMVCA